MTLRAPTLALLLTILATGCGSGGGKSHSRSTAAPVASGSTASTASMTSSTTAGTGSGATTLPPGVSGDFTRAFQGRTFNVVVPASYLPTTPAPVLLALHEDGADVASFRAALDSSDWMAAAAAAGVIVVVPETKSPTGSFLSWSGTPSNDLPMMGVEADELLALLEQAVATEWAVDLRQLHAMGFADGGVFLGAVGLQRPALATCTIVGDGWGAFDITPVSVRRPVHMICGTADTFYPSAQETQAFLAARGHEVQWDPVLDLGHSLVDLSVLPPADSIAWCVAHPLTTTPGMSMIPATPEPAPTKGAVTRRITTASRTGAPSVSLTYDVYVPASYTATVAAPVVFAVNVGIAPWRAIADAEGVIVIDLRDHDRDGAYTFDYDIYQLDAALRDVDAVYNIDRRRIVMHGFAAGANWAYAVGFANGNLIAGLGITAGSLADATGAGVFPANVQRAVPVAITHGAADAVVPVQTARDDRARLMAAGIPVELTETAAAHVVAASDATTIWSALRAQRAP